MRRRFEAKTPSPATVISIVAVVFAVGGTALAGVATVSVLTKKEKKQTRKIANAQISKRAPGLSVAHAANAQNAASANTAVTADKLDGADFCRTNGVVTLDDDDPEQTLCVQGPLSVHTFCSSPGTTTSALLRITTTAAGTFLRSAITNVSSTPGAQANMAITQADDMTTGDGPVVSPAGSGDFSAAVPSTNDQLNGVASSRAEATATGEGTCDFTLGAIN